MTMSERAKVIEQMERDIAGFRAVLAKKTGGAVRMSFIISRLERAVADQKRRMTEVR